MSSSSRRAYFPMRYTCMLYVFIQTGVGACSSVIYYVFTWTHCARWLSIETPYGTLSTKYICLAPMAFNTVAVGCTERFGRKTDSNPKNVRHQRSCIFLVLYTILYGIHITTERRTKKCKLERFLEHKRLCNLLVRAVGRRFVSSSVSALLLR